MSLSLLSFWTLSFSESWHFQCSSLSELHLKALFFLVALLFFYQLLLPVPLSLWELLPEAHFFAFLRLLFFRADCVSFIWAKVSLSASLSFITDPSSFSVKSSSSWLPPLVAAPHFPLWLSQFPLLECGGSFRKRWSAHLIFFIFLPFTLFIDFLSSGSYGCIIFLLQSREITMKRADLFSLSNLLFCLLEAFNFQFSSSVMEEEHYQCLVPQRVQRA